MNDIVIAPILPDIDAMMLQHITTSALGAELDDHEARVLADIMDVHRLEAGDVLAEESAEDSRLFLLAEGFLSVTDRSGDSDTLLYRMGAGETAGTRAFVDRRARNTTLRATQPSTVYSVEPERFEALLKTHPTVVYKVMRALFRITHANLMRMNVTSDELTNYMYKAGGRY